MTNAQDQKIVVTVDGPYVVSGTVPLAIQVITPNEEGLSWDWTEGASFPTQPTYKLCRCGRSKTKPFCDGTHAKIGFDGTETASRVPIARQSETYDGPTLTLSDAEDLCAFARFCDVGGNIWSLIEATDDAETHELVIRTRNRLTLCRCGASVNKPFCNGSHASIKFHDGLMG